MNGFLKCDSCNANTVNGDEIWELSKSLQNIFNVEHLCNKCLSSLPMKLKKISKDQIVFANGESQLKEELKKVVIFCDGACRGNPGESASGIAIFVGDKKPVLMSGFYDENGTNNTAELKALKHSLMLASIYINKGITDIEIKSDSQYSINSLTKWASGWEQKGWKKKGGEIKNLELIKEMYYLWNSLKNILKISYVKGHAGILGNELADKAANYGIDNKIEEIQTITLSD